MSAIIEPDHQPLRWFTAGIKATYNAGTSTWDFTDAFNNPIEGDWTITNNSPTAFSMRHRGFVDLQGLQHNYMTCNPLSYNVTRWGPAAEEITTHQAIVSMIWCTATKPIPQTFNINEITYSENFGPSYDDLVGMKTEIWSSDAATAMMVLGDSQTLGTLTATAAERLYTLFQFAATISDTPSANDVVQIFPAVVTIQQQVTKESTLAYIMRLKQAYDT